MSDAWRLLVSGAVAPALAMAEDEVILLNLQSPVLRLYRWSPHAVSLGYFQRWTDFDFIQFEKDNVPVVRRLTGGGAIFHGDEVTFSIAANATHPLFAGTVLESYERVHAILATAIENICAPGARVVPRRSLNLHSDLQQSPWCFHESTAFDLTSAARKLVGSAQRRAGGRILHHGSIVIKSNRYTPQIASIEMLGGATDPAILEHALMETFEKSLNIQFNKRPLDEAESALAERLAREKYSCDAWTKRR